MELSQAGSRCYPWRTPAPPFLAMHQFMLKSLNLSRALSSSSTASLPPHSGAAWDTSFQSGERRSLDNWGYSCLLSKVFASERTKNVGLFRWNTLHEAFMLYFFSAVRVKKLSASDSSGCWALLVFIFLPSVICANCYFMHMEYTTSSLSSLVWSKSLAHVENNKQKLTCSLPSLMSITTSNYLEY